MAHERIDACRVRHHGAGVAHRAEILRWVEAERRRAYDRQAVPLRRVDDDAQVMVLRERVDRREVDRLPVQMDRARSPSRVR
jgi:hypothetical protein